MLNIVQIANRPQGSVGNIVVAAAEGFAEAGHKVTNVFIKGAVDNHLAARAAFESISYAETFAKHGQPAVVNQLKKLFQQQERDVIIAHCYHPCKFSFQASRELSIKRKIVVFHGLGNLKRLRRKLFTWLFLRDWLFAGVSRAVAKDIVKSGAVLKADQVRVVCNGLDFKALESAQLTRGEARDRLGLPRKGFLFGNIGRLSDSKNQGIIVEAYARVVDNLPPSRLVIIGEGRKQKALLALVAEHGLQGRVRLAGYVPDAHLYLKAFDLFLFPSISEAFGLALLEAMIARVPAIVSDVGGIPELVGDYPYRIQPNDVAALADLMMAMASKSDRERDRIAGALYARAMARYDIDKMKKAYLEIILPPLDGITESHRIS